MKILINKEISLKNKLIIANTILLLILMIFFNLFFLFFIKSFLIIEKVRRIKAQIKPIINRWMETENRYPVPILKNKLKKEKNKSINQKGNENYKENYNKKYNNINEYNVFRYYTNNYNNSNLNLKSYLTGNFNKQNSFVDFIKRISKQLSVDLTSKDTTASIYDITGKLLCSGKILPEEPAPLTPDFSLLKKALNGDNEIFYLKKKNKNYYIIIFVPLRNISFPDRIMGVVQLTVLANDVYNYISKFLLISIFLSMALIFISIFINLPAFSILMKEVYKLADLSYRISQGNFNVRINSIKQPEIKIIGDSINNALDKIKFMIDSYKIFFLKAAHQLRTPITAIKGSLEVIMKYTPEFNSILIKNSYKELEKLEIYVERILNGLKYHLNSHPDKKLIKVGEFIESILNSSNLLFYANNKKLEFTILIKKRNVSSKNFEIFFRKITLPIKKRDFFKKIKSFDYNNFDYNNEYNDETNSDNCKKFKIETFSMNNIKNISKVNYNENLVYEKIFIDPIQLLEAMLNLFDNGIKYSFKNSVVRSGIIIIFNEKNLKNKKIKSRKNLKSKFNEREINKKNLKNILHFYINTRGEVITQEKSKNFFKLFYSLNDSNIGSYSNSIGVGLSIVKEIIEAHNGYVNFRGNKAGSNTFLFKIFF